MNPFWWSWGDSGLAPTTPATTYTLVAPTPARGLVDHPSGNWTVTPDGDFTGTITLSDGGAGGTFSVPSLTWTGDAVPQTFKYTPNVLGLATISSTNDGGLTDPSDVDYLAVSFNPLRLKPCMELMDIGIS